MAWQRELEFEGSGGITLRADTFGDPEAPPVVLLHGGGQTRHAWKGTARRLAGAGYHALAVDLRGHGDSDWAPDHDYSLEAFAEDLRLLATRLSRKPVAVGASMGGMTALVLAGELGDPPLSGLILVDVVPRLEEGGVSNILAFMTAAPHGFASVEEAAEHVARYLPHRPRPRDLSGLEKNLRRSPDGRLRWHWDPAFLDGRRDPATRPTQRLQAAARSLRIPTLLVKGRLSDVVSDDGVQEFLSAVPHARYVDVGGAGHMVAGDRNDAFTDAVIDFLTDVFPSHTGAEEGGAA